MIDRNIGLGLGGVLWSETRGLADPGAVVQNYMAGLGGGDVRPEHIRRHAGRSRNRAKLPARRSLMEAV